MKIEGRTTSPLVIFSIGNSRSMGKARAKAKVKGKAKRINPEMTAVIIATDARRVQQLLSRTSLGPTDWEQVNDRIRFKTSRSLFGYLIEKRATTVFNIVVADRGCQLPLSASWASQLIDYEFISWEFVERLITTGWPKEIRGRVFEATVERAITLDRLENQPEVIPYLGNWNGKVYSTITTPTFETVIERSDPRRVEAFYISMLKSWNRWSLDVRAAIRPGLVGRPIRLLKPHIESIIDAEVRFLEGRLTGYQVAERYGSRFRLLEFLFETVRRLQKRVNLSNPMVAMLVLQPQIVRPDQIEATFVRPSISRLLDPMMRSEAYQILPLNWFFPVDLKMWIQRFQKSGSDEVWRILKRVHKITEIDRAPITIGRTECQPPTDLPLGEMFEAGLEKSVRELRPNYRLAPDLLDVTVDRLFRMPERQFIAWVQKSDTSRSREVTGSILLHRDRALIVRHPCSYLYRDYIWNGDWGRQFGESALVMVVRRSNRLFFEQMVPELTTTRIAILDRYRATAPTSYNGIIGYPVTSISTDPINLVEALVRIRRWEWVELLLTNPESHSIDLWSLDTLQRIEADAPPALLEQLSEILAPALIAYASSGQLGEKWLTDAMRARVEEEWRSGDPKTMTPQTLQLLIAARSDRTEVYDELKRRLITGSMTIPIDRLRELTLLNDEPTDDDECGVCYRRRTHVEYLCSHRLCVVCHRLVDALCPFCRVERVVNPEKLSISTSPS